MQHDIRLMIETTEETSGHGMEYYLENETAPEYNIVLDSDYPAVTAEKGYDVAGVQGDIESSLEDWRKTASSPASFEVTVNDWMYRDPSGAWLNLLLEIYGDTTGEPAEPVSSAGSTTAKLLPNAVNFGPKMPTDK